jgi:uncharacterized protein
MTVTSQPQHLAKDGVAAQRFDVRSGAISMVNRVALLSFIATTFTWSWSLWLLSALVYPNSGAVAAVLSAVASFGPSVSASAVVLFGSGPVEFRRWLRRCLQWRVGWRWMALAFLLPLAVMSGVALSQLALGGMLVPSPAHGQLLMAPAILVGVFFAGGPLGEEFGWRGYALPALQNLCGWRGASLVVAVLWGLWHLPLFFLAGTTQSQTPMLVFMPMIAALSILFAWLFNRTGHSVVPALVLHTAFNAWAFLIPTLPSDGAQRPSEIAVGVFVLIALALLFDADRAADLRVR